MGTELHTKYTTKDAKALDALWMAWSNADHRAERKSYENEALNAEADKLWAAYEQRQRIIDGVYRLDAECKRRKQAREAAAQADPWETDEADVWDTGDSFSAYSGDVEAYHGLHW
ncbi:MAG: hypothetical protein KDD89_10475 [Anaerolineales bacterium]|nr:hypothetical protein [Anaerolineales bacterium]